MIYCIIKSVIFIECQNYICRVSYVIADFDCCYCLAFIRLKCAVELSTPGWRSIAEPLG